MRHPPRLDADAYAEGAVHVVVGSYHRRRLLEDRALARALFAPWRDHRLVLATCLMPDHLHWLALPAPHLPAVVCS